MVLINTRKMLISLVTRSNLYFRFFSVLLISVFIFICYRTVGNVPFYLDDFSSIVYNPLLKSPVDYWQLWQVNKARFIPYSFFALQNELFAGKAYGFHFVSLFIHVLNAIIIGLLVAQLAQIKKAGNDKLIFIFAALLFGLAPQNSQAVIYIVQQAALIATFFYIASLYCYCKFRSAAVDKQYWLWAFLFSLCFICSFLSKQNVASLPLVLLLIEWIFFRAYIKPLLVTYVGISILSLFILFVKTDFNAASMFAWLDAVSRETVDITRIDYFRSQLSIIFHYIVQFFYPVSLRLEYDWKLTEDWSWLTIFMFVFHLSIIIFAIKIRKKIALLSFGIIFYYLAHIVESSFLPIKDIVFEHRTYLPNAGLVIAILGVVFYFRLKKVVLITLFTATFILAFYVLSSRLVVWQNPANFYENEVELSPKNPRSFAALAGTLVTQNNCPKALGYFDHAIGLYRLQPKYSLGIQPETLQNYITCLRQLKIYTKADIYEQSLLSQVKEPVRRSGILLQRGIFLITNNKFKQAEKALTEAIKLNDKNYAIIMNLAIVKLQLNKIKHAEILLHHISMIRPKDKLMLKLLQKISDFKNTSQNKIKILN